MVWGEGKSREKYANTPITLTSPSVIAPHAAMKKSVSARCQSKVPPRGRRGGRYEVRFPSAEVTITRCNSTPPQRKTHADVRLGGSVAELAPGVRGPSERD